MSSPSRITIALVGTIGALFLASTAGCSSSYVRPGCSSGDIVGCACSGGLMGTQACSPLGEYGACACTGPSACEEGALFACTCDDGSRGAQECSATGAFGPCGCDAPAPACIPGASAPCTCAAGVLGAQVCLPDGAFDTCVCEPLEEACVPGRSLGCTCADGSAGAQVCRADGEFGPCSCVGPRPDAAVSEDAGGPPPFDAGVHDAAMPDGGVRDAGTRDAGPPDAPTRDGGPDAICDPYAGETCGCPEVLPPSAPTLPRTTPGRLATGSETLIDVFPVAGGVVVVLVDSVRLLSRDGAELARWVAPREITAASFDGARLAIADRAAVTTLSLTLVEQHSTFLTEECASSVLVSCGHFVCGPSNDWDRIFYTYQFDGPEIARSMPFTYNGIPMRRVPGVDAFVTVTTSSSPSDFHFYRVQPSGEAVFTTESPYHGDFPVSNVYAFTGRPASHLITHQGRLLRLDTCLTATRWAGGSCLEQDGSLGTLLTGEQFVAVDSGADGKLYALTGTRPTSSRDPMCSSGCRVQRIDPSTRRVVTQRAIVGPFAPNVQLRHDAWAGRALVFAPTCATSYPYACTGWTVWTAAYE